MNIPTDPAGLSPTNTLRKRAAALLGVARQALVKRRLSQFVFNEDQDVYYLHHNRLAETGIPQAFELRLVKNDETVIWARLNTTTLHDAADTPVFRVVLSDITEHRMAVEVLRQSELRESENQFEKLFEQHSAIKLILDAETGGVIDANEAAVEFYGWPIEKLKQMNIEEINTLPPILAIPDQIKQVFLDLLANAADACLQGGGVITISTWQEDGRVAVAIKDTGAGIDPEKIDLIFQPFYTTKPEVKGTGLGLSICHGIIQGHYGEFRVESRPGEGATFTVLLPIKGD